jgi:hypothetical protein
MEFIDVMTLLIILFVVATLVAFVLWLASLPGKIARERGHAQADAVNNYRAPAGASGAAAIYTDRVPSFKIIRRVMLRWYTWLNYIKMSL